MKYLKKFNVFERFKPVETTKGEYFHFLIKQYNVEKAWDLIRKNPKKFVKPDGSYYKLNVDEFYNLIVRTTDETGAQIDITKTIGTGGSFFVKGLVGIKKDLADSITEEEVETPVIFIKDGDFQILIDGWHRVYKAKKLGKKTIDSYIIKDEADLKKIRMI